MNNKTKPYDPNIIMKNVADKIKASFAELIPDDEWEKMVKKQIDNFTQPKKNYYTNKEEPSEFDVMCQSILKELAHKEIKKHIETKYGTVFQGQNKAMDDALKELLTDGAGVMMANIMAQQARLVFTQMVNQNGIVR